MARPSLDSGRQALRPSTDRPQAASPDFLSDIVLGTESTGFVEDQAEVAADDFFLDLGGAAEASWNPWASVDRSLFHRQLSPGCCGRD